MTLIVIPVVLGHFTATPWSACRPNRTRLGRSVECLIELSKQPQVKDVDLVVFDQGTDTSIARDACHGPAMLG
jgi:hypothetical protein